MSRLLRTCTCDGCSNSVWSREMCRKHYYRWSKHGDPSITLLTMPEIGAPQAFIDAIPAEGVGCLIWPFSCNNMGYAQRHRRDGGRLVSRYVCERFQGSPPSPQHQAAHLCGKGHEACVAPWHLRWKLPVENMADQLTHGTRSCGEKHATKLTAVQASEIKALAESRALTQAEIASRFGVSQTLVSHILLGKTWSAARGEIEDHARAA